MGLDTFHVLSYLILQIFIWNKYYPQIIDKGSHKKKPSHLLTAM